MSQSAFVLRIAPSGVDRLPEALEDNQIMIGWAKAQGLLDEELTWEQFREVVHKNYYEQEQSYRRAGAAAGHLWRFLRDMKKGDLVIVPHRSDFYVAKITGPPTYGPTLVGNDTSYRRPVEWLNEKRAISRQFATSAMVSRMKIQGTSADAPDLVKAVESSLDIASRKEAPTFQHDLQERLVRECLSELRDGRMDSFKFEKLIEAVLRRLGSKDVRIIPRGKDKGADILAPFLVAGVFQQVVAVQAKHWRPDPPVGRDVVEQLIRGIEAESAHLGMVITSGSVSDQATQAAERYFTDKGIRIELIDGAQFAKLIVEQGIVAS